MLALTYLDGVNQICECTDQKNSLQCVNHNLHVAQAVMNMHFEAWA